MTVICGALIAPATVISSAWAAKPKAVPQTPLTGAGQKLETRYANQLKKLRTELTAKVPQNAVRLEHAVPMKEANPAARADAPETIDPLNRSTRS